MNIIYYIDKTGKTRIGYFVKKVNDNYTILHKSKDGSFKKYVNIKKENIIKIEPVTKKGIKECQKNIFMQ